MEVKRLQKITPLTFSFGILLLIGGIGRGYIEGGFDRGATTLTLMGFLGIIVFIILGFFLFQKNFTLRLLKQYMFFFFFLSLLILSLVGLNYLAHRYDHRFDLTKTRQHTLSPTTQDIIQNLHQEVRITVFHVGLPPKYLEDLLQEYERLSRGRIKAEVIDPLVQIGYAAQFGSVITGEEKKAIVQSGVERKDINFKEENLTEEMLTKTILSVTRDKRRIYFLVGHDEFDINDTEAQGYSVFRAVLENNNCLIKELWLGKEKDVPPDCDVLVIAGAKNPLTPIEEELIQRYLKKGGNALFLIESTPLGIPERPITEEEKRKNPTLNNILNHWGININDDIVVDLENYVGADVGCPATRNYPPHRAIVENLDYTFYIRPWSITFLENRPETIQVAPLVFTASWEKSWAETSKTLEVKFDVNEDTKGPIMLAAIVWEPKNEEKEGNTKIIVLTDGDFITNNFIQQYSNAQMALNAVSWLSEIEYTITFEPKKVEVPRLDLISRQKRSVVVILIVLPLTIASFGVLVWLKQN